MIANVTRGKSFKGVINYLTKDGKRARVIYANLAEAFGEQKNLIRKLENHAYLHRQVKKPVYHLSLSPAKGDNLSPRDWIDSIKSIVKTLNLENHQTVVLMHRDTKYPNGEERPHLHLVINTIGDDGKCANFLSGLFAH